MRQFKTLAHHVPVDLINYIVDYILEHQNTEVLIGCDSQNRKRETIYAVVIGLYTPGKGAHVLYSKHSTVLERERAVRLLNEVWLSVETAEFIKKEAGIKADWIDIDINPDPKYGSNSVLSNAVGLVTGLGYKVRHKGNSPMMCYCADSLVK